MIIDAVIPVYKPGGELQELLRRLEAQVLPIRAIYLMETRSAVELPRRVREDPQIRIVTLEKEDFDHGGTRDRGARLSDAEYLLFLTQDALPRDKQLTKHLASAFADPRVKAAYARQLPREDCSRLERYTRDFNYPAESRVKTSADLEELGIKTFFCSNVCAMYERETYLKQGGFIRRTIFNEDMIYAGGLIQQGYAIAYAAEAEVIHSHNYTAGQQFHRNFDLAVSQADHPEIFSGIASEGEGLRLVKRTALCCLRDGRPWLIFRLVILSASKYIGYKLGRNYQRLPRGLVLRCTMNRAYWG